MSQQLHESLGTDEINGLLGEGAMLVWIEAGVPLEAGTGPAWNAVLDHPDYPEETGVVLAWLDSINPGAVDEAMLKGSRLSQSPGTTALNALKQLAAGDGS